MIQQENISKLVNKKLLRSLKLKLRIFQSSMPERRHTCLIPCSILQKEIDRAELDSLCFGAKSMLSYSNQLDKNMLPEGTKYHQSQLKQNELCRVLTHITSSKFMLNLKLCSCVLCSQLNGINQVLACRWLESEDVTFAAKLQFKELQESSLSNNLDLGNTSKWPANPHVRSKANSSGFFIHSEEIWSELQKFNYNFIHGL